jgi:hypothetical protein
VRLRVIFDFQECLNRPLITVVAEVVEPLVLVASCVSSSASHPRLGVEGSIGKRALTHECASRFS